MKKTPIIACLLLSAGLASANNFSDLYVEELQELENFKNGEQLPHDNEACRAINSLPAHQEHWVTPTQPLGPFYPITEPSEVDTDLTHVDDKPQASGTPIYVQGQIQNRDGQPIENAVIEIWQACETGRYNHPRDTNEAALDENFQYYAKTTTRQNGEYIFRTIFPGAYPADVDWIRPPHIHMKVSAQGYDSLITQMYFDPNSFPALNLEDLNQNDRILRRLSATDRAKLIVSFAPSEQLNKDMLGSFIVYLKTAARR